MSTPLPNGCTVTLAVTGASGSLFAAEALRQLTADARVAHIDLLVSDAAHRVLAQELALTGRSRLPEQLLGPEAPEDQRLKVHQHLDTDIAAPIASGSYPSHAMIVLPCSMGTLAGIAHGLAASLIQRAADVTLKQRRPLLLCVRETPLNLIHLRNMTAAAEAGASIVPVMPALYSHPATIQDVVRTFVHRVLDLAGLPQPGAYQWPAGTG